MCGQVVGVIRQGLDLLDLLDDVPRSPDDTPLMRIKVVKCGNTNAQVTHAVVACRGAVAAAQCKVHGNMVEDLLRFAMSHGYCQYGSSCCLYVL
jgi:hypothetical protein